MNGEVYGIGDIVQIRDWDDMADEFGENKNGSINCPMVFVSDMRNLCGETFQIDGSDNDWDSDWRIYYGHNFAYTISGAMIKRAYSADPVQISEIDIL